MLIAAGFEEYLISKGVNHTHINSIWAFNRWYRSVDIEFYFQITNGKYKGSIGTTASYGKLKISSNIYIPILTPGSMKFLKDYEGQTKLVVPDAKPQYDISGKDEITVGDTVMYTISGSKYITIAKVLAFNPMQNNFKVATADGIRFIYSRNMVLMNTFDIDSELQKITVAMLQSE